jgi:hypothetical protein
LRLPASANPVRLGGLAAVTALLAAAELLVGAANLVRDGRAEWLVFAGPRPWLLLLLALLVSRLPPGWRIVALFLFLLLAGAAESAYLLSLGNHGLWPDLVRGFAAAAAHGLLLCLILGYARSALGRTGLAAAAVASALVLAAPAFRDGWRAAAVPAETATPTARKPELLLMTALPIVWGEGGAFDPESRPAGAYRMLQREFVVRPVDTLDARSLSGGKLLLLAQPRWLAPAELVAFDGWVRAGGRVLILTDPLLEWPSELPLGDVRRPPPVGLLGPLLDHWGVTVAARRSRPVYDDQGRRLILHQPGALAAAGSLCRVVRSYRAECRIGRGRAIVLADADLLRDDLWMAPGQDGGSRDRRVSDNPLVVADLLDRLAGVERERAAGPVFWAAPGVDLFGTLRLLLAGLLLLAAASGAAALLLRRRTR